MKLPNRRSVEVGVVGLLVLAIAGFAVAHEGVPAAEVDLNDGGVWVTNAQEGLVAHLNYQSRVLDGGLDPLTRDFDLTQEGNAVLLHDRAGQGATPIDTATVTLGSRATTGDLAYSHGDDLVLVADATEGTVWAATLDTFATFNPAMDPLLAELDAPRVIVGRDGRGFVVEADGTVTKVESSEAGFVTEEVGSIPDGVRPDAQLTVAGEQVVAVDEGRVRTVGSSQAVAEITANAVIQQPSLQGGRVSLALPDALLIVPLGGAATRVAVGSGSPAAPVDVDGCVYGAWSGSGAYAIDCHDQGRDLVATNDTLAGSSDPVFRVSRSIVAINDAAGNVYLPNDGMRIINDWKIIKSQVEEQDDREEEDSEEQLEEETIIENVEQEPPVANDDEFGARPGVTTNLPVLLNDLDVDGDVLTVHPIDVPEGVSITPGRHGRSAQITMPADATGPVTFTYQAFDGEEYSNTASVTVTPRPPGTNGAPQRVRDLAIHMSEQASVRYSVLPDWVDPDGDPIYLVSATGDEGMAVTYRQDGFVSLRDLGTAGAGRRSLEVVVSDGTDLTTEEIRVQVAPGSSDLPPVANGDHYVVNVGEQVVLRPLSNDSEPNGQPMTLAEISPPAPDQTLEIDYEQASALFSSTRVGTHELTYVVSDGLNPATGKIRVDVTDPAAAETMPNAQNDLALLPVNSSVLVSVLDNDHDPGGGVLAVQSLSLDEGTGLTVEVINHSVLRVSAPAELTDPVSFGYTVSNGKESATARVLVLPQGPRATNQPPVANPDSAIVRTGDIVAIPVLDNDYSPTDLELSVDPEIEVRGEGLGEVFVSGDQVRFRAGDTAGAVTLVYSVIDSAGNRTSSLIDVTVRDFESGNQKPAPRPVAARVFAGATAHVAVPLDGVDPDGDSVELIESASKGPKLGSIALEDGNLVYTASRGAGGTDTFTYQVRDRFGLVGEASISIGVIPPPDTNQLPVAVPDKVTVRPGQKIELPVTQNDVDPDGDDLSIVADSAKALAPWEWELQVKGQDVRLTTPEEPGTYQFSYDITDGGGSPVTGYVTVIVDPAAAPLPPVALDDRVAAAEIARQTEVIVDVTKNDRDPDGAREDLNLEVEAPAELTDDGQIRVPLADDAQVLLYTITDPDGLSSRAALFVPGKNNLPPMLNPDRVPAKVKGGETLRVDFAEYVLVREGHTAQLTLAESVVAGAGGSTADPEGGLKIVSDTVIEFTPDPLFIGPTSLTFEVHDGETLEDPRGLRATLSLPIEVESSGLFPPELRPSPVEVAPGEAPISVRLSDMVDDPDPGDNEKMAYSLVSAPGEFSVAVSGQELQVSTDAKTPPGTSGTIVVSVHDGTTDPVELAIPASVVRSTRPLISTVELTDPEARVGFESTFDLTTAVTNPFADQGGEVTFSDPVINGPAAASISGSTLTVTPSDIGPVVVNYTASDATGDVSRQVTGQVSLTVKDAPLAPVNVSARALGSRTVEVQWTQGDLRGGTLQHFIVKWAGGSHNCGLQTICTITGLTNNVTYNFSVTQVTEVGESAPSGTASARPDVMPNAPAVPTTSFGDRQIEVSWPATTVPDGGSPVKKYKIQVTPGIGGQTVFETSATSWTATGLNNGTGYTFRIQAINDFAENVVAAEANFPWGGASAPEVPAGAPSGLAVPTVVKDKAAAGVSPRVAVSWSPPSNPNGDTTWTFELREVGTTNVLYSGPATSTAVNLAVSTQDRRFEVRAANKSIKLGLWSEWSSASNAVRAFQPPGAVTGFSLEPTGQYNTVRFNFTPGAANGALPGEIVYRWSAGGGSGTVTSGQSVTNSVFVNGQNVAVTLTPIATVNGETAAGPSATATVNAYGPPSAASASASGSFRRVDFSWSADANSGGRPSTVTTNYGHQSASGTHQQPTGYGSQACITVTVTNSANQATVTERCATSWAAPVAYTRYGPQVTCIPGLYEPCFELHVELQRFPPNSTITCQVPNDFNHGALMPGTFRTDANGAARARLGNYMQSKTAGPDDDVTINCTPRE